MGRLSERETQRVVAAVKQILAQASLTTVAAAKICGVPQQTISRLQVKPPRRLQWRVLERLVRLDPTFKWNHLVLHPRARDAIKTWKAWVSTWAEIPGTIALLQRLPSASKGRRAVENFKRWATERGHDPRRVNAGIRLALRRVIRHEETAGIEREWGDLSATEKDHYLVSAMRSERIILDRPSESECARRSFPVQPARENRVRRVVPRTAWELEGHRKAKIDMDTERARLSTATRDMLAGLRGRSRRKDLSQQRNIRREAQ